MKSSFARYRSVGHKLVTGFMEPEVLLVAGALDEAQRARSVGGAVAEIGVHHGKLFIGLNLLQRDDEKSVAIDIFGDQDLNIDGSGAGDLAKFTSNVDVWSSMDSVVIHQGDSTKLTPEVLLEEAGGLIRPMLSLTASEQASVYSELFQRRWGFAATGQEHLAEVFDLLREFMTGSLIYLNDQPVAIQILYRVEAPRWISLEYINGGVDPQQRDFSPGSVLSFVNTQDAWAEARALGKPLRYSFGRADREYKDRWCHRVACYQT